MRINSFQNLILVAGCGPKRIVFDLEYVRDISERVYRKKLDYECGENTAKMTDDAIAKGVPGPDGKPRMSIRARAAAYDKITRVYLEVLGIKP